MRSFLAGLTLCLLASTALGQVRGEVESIGFGGEHLYRPQCWTPMVVRLTSQISEPAEYRLEVHQRDLDFDHVIFVKDGITLNGQSTQRWEICFLPEPVQGGLDAAQNPVELQDRIRVYLTNKEGTRQLIQLPITSMARSLETGTEKPNKLVLVVMEGSSRPALTAGSFANVAGIGEYPQTVAVRPSELPQSPQAYEAVDAVVWISGDAHVLAEEGSKQFTALQQWVRAGGQLYVCQPSSDGDRPKIEPLAEMLPILWKVNGEWKVSVHEKEDLEPLPTLAKPKSRESWGPNVWKLQGKFPFARATAKPQAVVDQDDWIVWDKEEKDKTPYIVRGPYGLGCVTWIAQDLGDPTITGPKTAGWPYVWLHVFGWVAPNRFSSDDASQSLEAEYTPSGSATELGGFLNRGVAFESKGLGFISLAVFFFIGYWLIAGPLSFVLLAKRQRKDLSWAAFAGSALVATLLTVVVVRLVLRGNAEIHHATNVRIVSGQQPQSAIAFSKLGVYIPRDGDQRIALADLGKDFVSYVSPMTVAPTGGENEFPANRDYSIPVHEEASSEAVTVDVPFRSTLKKLQAQWSGDLNKNIRANNVHLVPNTVVKNMIVGTLDNLTGVDLKNVYLAFHGANRQDYVIFVPNWPASGTDATLDFAKLMGMEHVPINNSHFGDFRQDRGCWGDMIDQWQPYWQSQLNTSTPGAVSELGDLDHGPAFAVLSLFDRCPPPKHDEGANLNCYVLQRRGARNLDMSPAVAAGQLVILAQTDPGQALPYPLQVDGDKVAGEGTVFYQFALPLDHGGAFSAPPPK